MKALFVCNMNVHRSPTAEIIFKDRFETKSAGISEFSITQLSKRLLDWADVVYVMEERIRTKISELFPKEYMEKKILSLDIPDIYSYMQPELVELLRKKVGNINKLN